MLFNSKFTLAASLAASALLATAQPIHIHNIHKRDPVPQEIVTVYVTASVTVGAADVAAAVESSTSSSSSTPVATSLAVSVSVASSSSSSVSVASSSAASVASSSSSSSATASTSSSTSTSTSTSSGSGGAKGIVYSPYKVGGCKSASEVKSDLASLSGYDIIRIYGVDCEQVENVLAGLSSGQKVFLGVYDVTAIESALSTIDAAVESYGWDIVHTISIGNELVNDGSATVSDISGYLSTARTALAGYGYTGNIVSVDTFIAVINNPGLCALSDYIAVNAHAYFDGGVTAADAGTWAAEQITRVAAACAAEGVTTDVLITETGWPSQGNTNGDAIPSKENQATAISGIKSNCGSSAILFTAYNDLWKSAGTYGVEQYFGIYSST